MLKKKLKLTKIVIDKIPFNKTGQTTYWDVSLLGFGLRVGRTRKTFIVLKKMNRKTTRRTVGIYGQVTPDQARREAQRLLGEMSAGKDPQTAKREARAKGVTLKEAFADYLDARKTLKPGTVKQYEYTMDRYFNRWLDRPVVSITANEIAREHKRIGESSAGRAQANIAMRVLRAVLFMAARRYRTAKGDPILKDNPVVCGISDQRSWYRIDRRRTVIKKHELPKLFDALDNLEAKNKTSKADTVKDYILFLLFTGLRRNEAAKLHWDDVDMKSRNFTIQDTKNNEPHTLPLSNFLYDLMKKRYENRLHDNPYVFPGKSNARHLVEPKRHINNLRKKAGLTFTVHDLRRTFASIAEGEVSAYQLKRLLNHKTSDLTAGYVITDVDSLRHGMQKITNTILRHTSKRKGDVIELKANRYKVKHGGG
ncbi:MAG: integrase [bacterium]|nr:MAG: integrase [bacterium]